MNEPESEGRLDDIQVSVLMPSYGYARFISDAIESFLRLDLERSELLVQDGGSTDGTLELLQDYRDRVRSWSEPDTGQSDALNKAFSKSRGRWIGWLNADEFYLPGGLEALLDAGERSGADVVFGDSLFVDVQGTLMRSVPQHPFSHWILRWYGCFIASVSAIFRRSALGEVPWDKERRGIMDWELYLRLAAEGARFLHVPRLVGAFRVHDERITANPQAYATDFPLVRERYGIPTSPLVEPLGKAVHGILKLKAGAYNRQLAAHSFRGRDLRWFRSEEASQAVDALYGSWYGKHSHRSTGRAS